MAGFNPRVQEEVDLMASRQGCEEREDRVPRVCQRIAKPELQLWKHGNTYVSTSKASRKNSGRGGGSPCSGWFLCEQNHEELPKPVEEMRCWWYKRQNL